MEGIKPAATYRRRRSQIMNRAEAKMGYKVIKKRTRKKKGEKSVKGCRSGNCIFLLYKRRSSGSAGSIERKVNLLVYSR